MIFLKRDDSNNYEFRNLVSELDIDLNNRYGVEQEKYNSYNVIEDIDTVVIAYSDDLPVGCGCFKKYDAESIEIKRMYVKPEFRGKGISKLILKELEMWGHSLGYLKAILETGCNQPEAIQLYKTSGYKSIENYGQYAGISESVCMKKIIVP